MEKFVKDIKLEGINERIQELKVYFNNDTLK